MKITGKIRIKMRWLIPSLIVFVLLTAYFLIHIHKQTKHIEFNEITIESPEWTLDPIRIVFFADNHLSPAPEELEKLRKLVFDVNELKPDLILIGGDYVAKRHAYQGAKPEDIAFELAKLEAPLGRYAVLGNHDHWHGEKRFIFAFASEGVPLIDDKSLTLEFKGKKFTLNGAHDIWSKGLHRWDKILPEGDLPRIVLTHGPDAFDSMPEPTALALAGHTHGGQIRLPFIGSPVVPSYFGQRYVYGIVREGRNTIYVTSGIGTSIIPFRLLRPAEVAIITLKHSE